MSSNGKDIRRALKATAETPKKPNPYGKDVIYDPMGQWKYPGMITKIPNRNITMKGVPYPVLGIDDQGNQQMMMPDQNYTFPGQYVTEYPQMQTGGTPMQRAVRLAEQSLQERNEDSAAENIAEIFDPTGITSWDDVAESYKKSGMSPQTYMEILGALPLLGKVGKAAKLMSGLAKTSRQARSLGNFVTGAKATGIAGKGSDTYQAYDQYQTGGWLDELAYGGTPSSLQQFKAKRGKTSKNIQSSINKLFLRNHTLYGFSGKNIYDHTVKFESGGNWLDNLG